MISILNTFINWWHHQSVRCHVSVPTSVPVEDPVPAVETYLSEEEVEDVDPEILRCTNQSTLADNQIPP